MQLETLLTNVHATEIIGNAEQGLNITGITTDPALCKPGFLYVAAECETVDSTRYGVRLDGRNFISEAIRNGAVAVLTTPEIELSTDEFAALIRYDNPLMLLGPLCGIFFGEYRPEKIALVTGTNGKTSTVNFCRQLWAAAHRPSCSVGNLGGVCSDGSMVWERDPTLSVPETVTLHKMLSILAQRGINHVAMEATSHALHDHRLTGVPASIGAFTNLTRDHLDFHHTMEEYFRVKMTLFQDVLSTGAYAVLNADTPWFEQARTICKARGQSIISYGWQGSEIRLLDCAQRPGGQFISMEVAGRQYQTNLNLFGLFQVSNVLCSLGIVIGSGISPEEAVQNIDSLTEVEGRLNVVAITPPGGRVVVDYAHSPDAIRAALEGCRSFTSGKLIVVFGCNGERDPGKRSEMGAMAASLADKVVVTDGHPRGEDPALIRRAVLAGAPRAQEIADRVEAIETTIRAMGPNDTVLIAGLGHENFRTIGDQRIPYSDTETAQRIVRLLAAPQS